MDIYKKALEKWGIDKQMVKAIEEMSELQKELCKAIIKGPTMTIDNLLNMAEEIADVRIMIEQVEIFLGLKSTVESFRQEKLDRLEKLVNEEYTGFTGTNAMQGRGGRGNDKI